MPGGRRLSDLTMYMPWRYLPGIAAAVIVVLIVLVLGLEGLEYWSLEFFFDRMRGARRPSAPIVIVTIDEPSFRELDHTWPFPRKWHAEAIRRIAAGKPLAIGVDILFPEPCQPEPCNDDRILGDAVTAAGNVVLGSAPEGEFRPGIGEHWDPNLPVPAIRRKAEVGPVNLVKDDVDGHVRRAPVVFPVPKGFDPEGYVWPFDVLIYDMARRAGLPARPLPPLATTLINFNGPPNTFEWVSYYKLILYQGRIEAGLREAEASPDIFRDKIVLIGPTSEIQHDVFPTAFARGDVQMPGVEIHANVIDTYLRGNYVREVPRWISTVLAAVAALAGAVLAVRLRALRAFVTAVLLWLGLSILAYFGFRYFNWWMRGMAGTLGLVLGYGATVVTDYVREQREKRRLSQFFSPEVLREVVRHQDDNSLGSSRRLVTVLFSDIRGFTTLSERLEPEQVAEMLHEYLSEMTEIVFKHGGTVDKYIGDCVMALYNAPLADPDHAANAVRSGLEFQEKTLEVSRRWEEKLGVPIRNGVGINTGEAVVGTMGSRQRLEYTAIGDTINLGARLESLTKEYGVSIIISEYTKQLLKGEFMTRELGEVTVKGKTQPVKIFGVLPASLRRYPRAMLEIAATLTLTVGDETCQATTRDISEGGMALGGVPEAWTPGTKVHVRCEGGDLPVPLAADAVIAWRRDDVAGISFTGLEPDVAPAVAEYVTQHHGR
ncbi:MAG TPA: CHASE2 domain-containing protein [Methylomirabilota bacterium]|nr:CHASE2 domain-containing protein [Methylomirabilota bacterium]